MSEDVTQEPHSQQWYERPLPDAVKKADLAPVGSALAINPETLEVPAPFVHNESLPDVLKDLRGEFLNYYEGQLARMRHEKSDPVMTPKEAFAQQVGLFCNVTSAVEEAIITEDPYKMVLFWDVDETIGRIRESDDAIDAGGLEKKPLVALTQDEHDILKSIHLKDTYDRLVINPAFPITANWIREHFGDRVKQGILTTKDQKGLDDHLTGLLDSLCPEAFSHEYIMSSRDGKAIDLIPELIEQPAEGERREARVRRIDIAEALRDFDISDTEKDVIMERIIDSQGGILTDYDMKLFMMGKVLKQLAAEGKNGGSFRKPIVMLADDAISPSALPHSQVRGITVPRFRLPDYQPFF